MRPHVLLVLPLLLTLAAPAADEESDADEKLLKEARVQTDGPGLIAFLRNRSLEEEDARKFEALVKQLGHDNYAEREAASSALVARGKLAAPFLRKAVNDPDAEVSRRAQDALQQIESGPVTAQSAAAVRLLAARKPDGAAAALLRFAPFADDDGVEDEILAALLKVGLRDGKALDAVASARLEKETQRRAAAGYVLGRSKDKEQQALAAKLLADADLKVRFRAAQGLLAGRDRKAVEALIDLIPEASSALLGQVEETLYRVAGADPPEATSGNGSKEERQKCGEVWAKWWKEKGAKIDLARLDEATPFFGYTCVMEMHGSKVWECDRDGKIRWELKDLKCPRHAQVLPGGRVLVGEVNANKVTERDLTGKVHWEHPLEDASFVQRLPNGNTFLGNHKSFKIVTRDGKEVARYDSPGDFFIHGMNRRPNGNVVCLSMAGVVRELSPDGKKVVKEVKLQSAGGNWSGVEGLPNGRYLCVEFNKGEVVEVDDTGKVHWTYTEKGASFASRMPNGLTMICGFSGQRILHVNREGKIVFEKKVGSSPWRASVR